MVDVPPDDPPALAPLPDALLPEELPDDPALEVPPEEVLLEPLLVEAPLWLGAKGILPPPHPARKRTANSRTFVRSMNIPKSRMGLANPLWPDRKNERKSNLLVIP